ncbi:hypothetical protein QFC22_006444 [Naganishia vaughanmartiniae]|uniref:Uncharacterized protein n=1 Tax=Naganishia vaughanmartiniae TaxID=1424756 RepID=A0ACC2WKD0_9TREE|nr:hypothetical protein QFC22_006444 [Naganishia vaughanmartiniae]
MSSDNTAAAAGQRRSTRTHRNDSASSSSHAATPAVAPTVPVLDPLQESPAVVEGTTYAAIFGGSESELSELSEAKDDTDDEAPPRAGSASPIPPVPLPRRRSPSPLSKPSKAVVKNKSDLPASSSGGSRKKKSRRVDSDSGDEELADAEAEPVERKKAPSRKRTSPKAAEDVGASKPKSGNERERAAPRKSTRPADDYKGDETSRKGDGVKKIITYRNEDGQRPATAKKDEGGNRPRIKLNVARPESQQPLEESETIEAEPSTKTKARSAKSGRADYQQEQQQSSRKVSDSKEDLRETSGLPGGRGNETKMAKRKADTEDEREDDRRRQTNKDRDRAGERGNRDQPRKKQKQDGFDDEEARDSYSDREPKRSKNLKGVRIEASSNDSRKRTSAEHASLSANKMSSVSFEKEYGVSTSQERLGAKTPRDGPRDRGGRTPYEGGKTPNERGGKTPKTPYSTEPEKGGHSSREEDVIRKKMKRREDKQQDMEIDTDDENVASTISTKPAKQRPTNDISMETPSDLSQSKKSKRDLKQEEDNSDGGRDDRKESKFSQAKAEDQPKKKKKARTVLPGDSIIDAGSDIEVNLGSTQRVSDKSSSRKKEEIDVDTLDDSEPVVSRPKLQKRPGAGDKTMKRVAELAGTGMGPRTPGEGKAKSGGESAAGVHQRRPGLQPVAKKSHYDPLGSALSSLPGIGPGISSGNTTPINRKPQTKQEVVFLTGARDELQQKREALYASQVQLNSMASGLLIQEYEDRPKPWRIRGNIARDDVTGKNTIAAVRAILEMRNNGSFKN